MQRLTSRNLNYLFLSSIIILGCDNSILLNEQKSVFLSEEDRELLNKMKKKEKNKLELKANPNKFITNSDGSLLDKGVINTYTDLTSSIFTNNSECDVEGIEGKITYMDFKNQEMAIIPFTINGGGINGRGELRAGSSERLHIEAATISGKAIKYILMIENVKILSCDADSTLIMAGDPFNDPGGWSDINIAGDLFAHNLMKALNGIQIRADGEKAVYKFRLEVCSNGSFQAETKQSTGSSALDSQIKNKIDNLKINIPENVAELLKNKCQKIKYEFAWYGQGNGIGVVK